MQTEIIIAIVVGVLVLMVILFFRGKKILKEAKYDFMRFALLINNCCLVVALIHLTYFHRDYYALGYLLPIITSYWLFFAKRFKNIT